MIERYIFHTNIDLALRRKLQNALFYRISIQALEGQRYYRTLYILSEPHGEKSEEVEIYWKTFEGHRNGTKISTQRPIWMWPIIGGDLILSVGVEQIESSLMAVRTNHPSILKIFTQSENYQ